MKKLSILCLLLLLASSCLAEMISVIYQPAELRDHPLVAGSQVLAQLSRYTPLELVGSEGEYLKVKDVNGLTGYLHRSLTGKIDCLVINVDLCNIRSGPGTNHPPAFRATRGTGFRIIGKEGDWLNILDAEGRIGWVAQKLTWGYSPAE